MKKLVVMVSMYNSGEWIENRLHNLLESSMLKDMEIWCVNADSPDPRDHDIPEKFAKSHPESIKYVRLPKRISVYETWNYIIENSKSPYLTNANTDDLIHPNGYKRLTDVLDKQPDFGFAYPSWHCTSLANQKWSKLRNMDNGGMPGSFAGNIDSAGVGHFPVWRRALHDKLGLFDTSFKAAADADWWCRCWWIGKTRFQWVNELLACYLWRNGDNLWNREITSEEWQKFHRKVTIYKTGKLE